MVPTLTAGVALRHPGTGAVVFLPTGSELPEWAAVQVGSHVLVEGPDAPRPGKTSVRKRPAGVPPPKVGAGSGRVRWAGYAADNGVEVDEAWSRDEVVAACEAAGLPTQ